MPLNLEDKRVIVAEVAEVAASAQSAIAAEYRGMTVAEMTDLRVKARQAGVYVRVVRNTLARRAMADTSFECMQETLVGPLILIFSREDPGSAARVIQDFTKENQKLVVKSMALGGKLLDPNDLDKLAKMPTYDEAIATLMSVMKAPISKFVRTLAEPHAKFVRTMAAVRDSKQESEST